MPVMERTRPDEALAARSSLRDQIARLEGELATILATTYPPIAMGPGDGARRRPGHPRLLDLAELERVRDDLAGRLTTAHRLVREQRERQVQARALLDDMFANPHEHRGALVTNLDLGLPGCTAYRVVPRLLSAWWRVKVSSGCPLPSRRT
jgi:hypothetical protein